MIEKIAEKLISTLTEPFMLLAIAVIYGLFTLLTQRDKDKKETDKEVFTAIKEQTEGLSECNKSICGMVPLLEVLVYGRGVSMKLIDKICSFLAPYRQDIEEIRQMRLELKEQLTVTKGNTKRIDEMIATLNGEESWMLKRVNKEGDCIDEL